MSESAADRERRTVPGDFVSFVGCSHGPGRLLKVAQPDQRRRIRVRCPVRGCSEGEHSTTEAMPRERRPGEHCDAVAIEPEPTGPKSDARAPCSDADILAAISNEWTSAADLAGELGYLNYLSFRNRLADLRHRAEAKGEPVPFESSSGPDRKLLIRVEP